MIQIQRTAELMAAPLQEPIWPDFPQIAAEVFNVTKRRILGRRKDGEVVGARHAAIWAAREYDCTYGQIGLMFGRHHTSCMNAVKAAEIWREREPWYAEASDLILQRARG